ncbi:sushi, von Willebrand factor type A, EGF and pentraxin domain-containing protein 1 isoform X2 [Nematostella vectensis]|uniref:sushi, von Willebrand factor type A, EGF and pentraxin domain-containing protein 1 isoform X2 n=1 Tax=Nematostella vectensis TaxID=45351 RepID=UPI002076FBFA|nr:sushi, von Willebrand factor type A, EGF and pentraxin domain-containing protein 1 isoform X2 [Nematostella vectensis]
MSILEVLFCKMKVRSLVFYFNCLVAVAASSHESYCPASIHSAGARITQVDLALQSKHVKKRLQGQSQMSCSQRCLQQDWCISVNYEVSRPEGGACELNTYGVEMLADANPKNPEFKRKKGWIYSQLRSAQFTLSLQACKDGSFTCSNGGTCEIDCKTLVPRCICPEGFSGDKCENHDNECQSSPCKNSGTCKDEDNGYTCACVPGFTDKNCETDINECAGDPCANGGTCTDGINGFTCTCPAGYNGSTCDNDIDECASNPCQNGATCNDGVNSYTCSCKPGFTGTNCETVACSSSPCQNGGSCAEKGGGLYGCTCASGYTGANCETAVTSGVGCVLHFTTKSTSNYIQLDQPFRWFDTFLVSVWLKMDADDHIDPAMILSYATASNVEALSIGFKKDGVAEIKFAGAGALLASGFTRDNTWQHLVFLYRNERFQVYKNNVLQEEKVVSGVAPLNPAGSILVIGQHQGSLGGNFDPSKLFYGYMANLNIWANALSDLHRGKVYEQGCTGSVDGNPALSWGTITGKTLLGNIQPQCALTCP